MADNKIIFTMTGVSKVIPPSKTILNNIYLSFYYGAKIGVLGLNGSGKTTLLKIIAGLDPNYDGKIVFNKNYKIGYLERKPDLDPEKTEHEVAVAVEHDRQPPAGGVARHTLAVGADHAQPHAGGEKASFRCCPSRRRG